jgi:hypothetical protein
VSQILNAAIAVIGVNIGKNSFHVVSHDERGAMYCVRSGRVARSRPALPICRRRSLLNRKLNSLGHDARQMLAKYVRPIPEGRRMTSAMPWRAFEEIRQQPGCSSVASIAINRVTDDCAKSNWSMCVVSAGAADANPAARAALYVQHALRQDYDLMTV